MSVTISAIMKWLQTNNPWASKPGDDGYSDFSWIYDGNKDNVLSETPVTSDVGKALQLQEWKNDYEKNTHKKIRYPYLAGSGSLGTAGESVISAYDWWR